MSTDSPNWLVVNASSGGNSDAAVADIRAALARAGRAPDRVIDVAENDCPALADLRAANVGSLTLFTGDGTLNATLTRIEGWDGKVLVLPGGTANLLSRALHGEDEAPAIAARAGTMAVARRHCIRSGYGTALIELLAGPGAKWSDVREEMRDGTLAAIADTAVEAARDSAAGSMVRIVAPPLGHAEGYAGIRLEPDAAGMAVSGYGARNVADYLLQGLALLRRDFREGPHDALGREATITCRSIDGEPIELMIDGERATGSEQEMFSLAPLDLNLLASVHD